jgi:hypothetical protein
MKYLFTKYYTDQLELITSIETVLMPKADDETILFSSVVIGLDVQVPVFYRSN